MLAVDGLGKDAGAGSLADSSRAAEKIGVSQFAGCDRILQGGGQRLLTYDGFERRRTVLSGGNDIILHDGFVYQIELLMQIYAKCRSFLLNMREKLLSLPIEEK